MSQEISAFPHKGTAHSLRRLKDVSSAPATDGQALVYNAVIGRWEPQTVTTDTSAIEADIDALQADVIAVESDVGTLQTDLNTAEAAIVTNASTMSTHIANTSNPHSVTHSQIGTIVAADLGAGAATDTVIGNRTADDATAHASLTGTLTQLLSLVTRLIKGITGESSALTAPDITLAATKTATDAATAHAANTSNPHAVTFAQVATVYTDVGAGDLSLGTTPADVPGLSISVTVTGTYLAIATFRVGYDSDAGTVFGYFNVAGSNGVAWGFQPNSGAALTAGMVFTVHTYITISTNPTTVKLQAEADTGATGAEIDGDETRLTLIRIA